MKIVIPLFAALTLPFLLSTAIAGNPAAWAAPDQLVMQRHVPVVDDNLVKILSALPGDEEIAVWVFFTDKGVFDHGSFGNMLVSAEASLTSSARARRSIARGADNLVDFRDLPVKSDYIARTLATGAKLRHTLRWFNAVTVDATSSQIDEIASLAFVRLIKKVALATADIDLNLEPLPPDISLVSLDYGQSLGQLQQLNAVVAHELGFAGQGVIVCMMDTGFRQQHDAFQNIINSGRLLAQHDFINNDDDTDYDPSQDSFNQPDHGTLTWSTLGGEAPGHLYGPSYMASFVLSKTEYVPTEHHIEEDNWAAGALWADSIGASVISSSLGYRYFDDPDTDYSYEDLDGNTTIVTIAADLAAYNGIAVANAMGNEGNYPGSLIAPADGDSVISCGAVDANGYLAGFSSWGPTADGRTKPEVCAQGVSTTCVDPRDAHGYTTASGTSLSTPLVGGCCGVLFSAHPNWTPMMVREALMMTADRADDPDIDYGWGIIDLGRALNYHPEGDIVFDHQPVLSAMPNQATPVQITVTGGAQIEDAFLYYREGDDGDFTQVPMSSSDNMNFEANIPGMSGSQFQYYFEAVDSDDAHAFYPLGGQMHPYTVQVDLPPYTIVDGLEDGLLYWKSGGTFDSWGLTAREAHTGNVSISDSPTTYYRDDTDSWLESTFSLDMTDGPSLLSFYYMGSLQSGRDSLHLEASTDGGESWTPFAAITGSHLEFTQMQMSMNDYDGYPDVRIRFHLTSDASGRRDGIFLDDISFSWSPTGTEDENDFLPLSMSLNQNYPNPFNPSTIISFSLPHKGQVKLAVFDLLGRQVRTLVSSEMEAGDHEMVWDGTDASGRDVASGIYLYKLDFGQDRQIKMMTLLR